MLDLGTTVTDRLVLFGEFVLVANGRLRAISTEGNIGWGYGGAGWRQPIISTGAQVNGNRIYVGAYEGIVALEAVP
jgi:hypothetical protein